MEFSRQEYWSELPFPSPGGLPNPGIEPGYPALQTDSLLSEPLGKPIHIGVAGNTWRGEDIGDRGWASASMGQTKCLLLHLMRLLPVFLTVKERQRGSWTRTPVDQCEIQFSSVQSLSHSLTVWDPMDYTVHGILQARIVEWVAIPFSRGSSQPRDRTQVFCIVEGFFPIWAIREAYPMWLLWQY